MQIGQDPKSKVIYTTLPTVMVESRSRGMGYLNFESGSGRAAKSENKMSDGMDLIFCPDLGGEEAICNALWNVGWQIKIGQHYYLTFTVTMVSRLSYLIRGTMVA
jgi:hypothetical protein